MTKEELRDKILDWTYDAGESFFDYYAHDRINNTSWAFWLLGKGFHEKANEIIKEHLENEGYVDQEVLYEVYPEHEAEYDENGNSKFSEENYHKNIELMAEFLLATPFYSENIMEWFKEQES